MSTGDGEDRIERMRTASIVSEKLFSLSRQTERSIETPEDKLSTQKIFLLRLFRPLVLSLSQYGTAVLSEEDFSDDNRQRLIFDPLTKSAWIGPRAWAWTEADRELCRQLSKNSKTLPILLADVMRSLRTETALALDADPELGKYLVLRTEEELAVKIGEFQGVNAIYYIAKYSQISIEDEAAATNAEEIEAAAEIAFSMRIQAQKAVRDYPDAVRRHGKRSLKAEGELGAELREWAAEFLPVFRAMLASLAADYPTPTPDPSGTSGKTDPEGGD